MTLNLVRRSVKGEPLTAADHDGNLDKLETAIEGIDPAAAVAAHVAEPDPHPQYLSEAEGDARYATAAQGTDAREWSAETISQAEAEAGTATTRRAFTAQRVFQAIAAWWAASAAATKLAGIASGATANSSDAALLSRANHTGTQAASTITGLAAVATSGAYGDLSGTPSIPAPADAAPLAPASAAAIGTSTDYAREDHVHPLPPLVSTSAAGLAPATSFAALTYGATVNLDLAALDGQARTITLTGNLELTTSNLAAGRRVVLRLLPGASQRALTFPTDWVFVCAKPATLAAFKSAVLSLTAFGTTNADVIAAYAVQP